MTDKSTIKKNLINQGYDIKTASIVASELVLVDDSLQPLVEKWLDGNETDYECHGYSIYGLKMSRGMTYPAALLTIDWLLKEPEKALASLKRGAR